MVQPTNIAHQAKRATELLDYVQCLTSSPLEQAAALVTAATVIIEREAGRELAAAALAALLEPTVTDWQRRGDEALQ